MNQFNISSGRGTEKGITTMNYPLIWSDDTGENMFAADEVIRYCWREFNGTGVAAIVGHLHSCNYAINGYKKILKISRISHRRNRSL